MWDFYIKFARKCFFRVFVEDKNGNTKDLVDVLSVSGLGDAMNAAVTTAASRPSRRIGRYHHY